MTNFPDRAVEIEPPRTVYEDLLRIEKLVSAAEYVADAMPILDDTNAPPLKFLLEEALQEVRALSSRVSD